MSDEKDFSEPDDLYRQTLYRDDKVVCRYRISYTLARYMFPLIIPSVFVVDRFLEGRLVPAEALIFSRPFLIVAAFWALFVLWGDLESPQIIRVGDKFLELRWWFGRTKVLPMAEIDIVEPTGERSDMYTFATADYTFYASSAMTNFAVLVDRTNLSKLDPRMRAERDNGEHST